jgi:carboxylesterase
MPAEDETSPGTPDGGLDRASRRRLGRRRKTILTCLLAVLLIPLIGNVLASWAVAYADRGADRDPATAILRGAESRDLGPEGAPVAVLLIHGFAGATNNFGQLPELLAAEGFRVRAMRLPGHGTSPRNLRRTEPGELVDAVMHEVDALDARHDRVVVVGHSMGGALGTLAAAQGHVDGLVLAAPYFQITRRWYYILPPETWIQVGNPFIRWVYKGRLFLQVNRREAKEDIVTYAWLPTRAGLTSMEVARRANAWGVLGDVTCPVLMLHGRDDAVVCPEAARCAFDAMASHDKRAVWLDRSNHHVFWDHDRQEVMREVTGFVRHLAEAS